MKFISIITFFDKSSILRKGQCSLTHVTVLTVSYVCLGDRLLCKQFHQSTDDGESSTDWSENIDFQCKEEEDQYIPIMEITSVCSMASNAITSEQSVRRRTIEVY